ncbi:uncharacterized protein LOC117296115 [Asterias rubens]|uniref:uncharacterized protein LOC117296115 n=1 Tax=Asterias rubens TaxID=7604 RepID=UPI0014550B43|nr:uncharacterized protein LOC117296115 [Asterias rubens]
MAGFYSQNKLAESATNSIEEEFLNTSACSSWVDNWCATAELNRQTKTISTLLEDGHDVQTFEDVDVTDNHWSSSAALRGECSTSFTKPSNLNQKDCTPLGFSGSNVREPAANYVDPTKHQSGPVESVPNTAAMNAANGGVDGSREGCRTDLKTLSPGKHRHRPRIGEPASRSSSPYSSDSLSSSSLSDRSASTTLKDTFSNETNENSSSGFDTSGSSDKEKTTPWSMANFDRVLHDAPKREHIRSRKVTDKSRSSNNQGTNKVGYQSDSGSSSSQSRNKPAKASQGTRSKLHLHTHGRTADIPTNYSGTSTSSGNQGHGHFDKSKTKFDGIAEDASQGDDTGISTANTSGQSTQYQSNFSMSSSSGACVESSRKGGKERTKNLPGKVSTHYHSIRTQSINKVTPDLAGSTPHHNNHFHQGHLEQSGPSNGDSASNSESERKRRRFNRTFVLLRNCGLLELTMQTASLMQQNCVMNQQLSALRQETGVLYNAISHLSSTQPSASFDIVTAHGILKNLKGIMNHDAPPHGNNLPNSQHVRRFTVKRNSSGETVSPDSHTQSSSAPLNSGSST